MTRQITAAIAEIQNGAEDFASRQFRNAASVDKRLGVVGRFLALPLLWLRRKRDRWVLAELTELQLRDIGLNSLDVWRECTKGFWRE